LGSRKIDIGFVGEGEAHKRLVCGRSSGRRYPVFIDVWDHRVVLRKNSKYKGCRSCGEVVEVVERERSEK